MKNEDTDYLDCWKNKFKNNKCMAFLIFVVVVIYGASNFLESLVKISVLFQTVKQKLINSSDIKKFNTKTFGIIVAPFLPNSKELKIEGVTVQNTFHSTLNARFRSIGILGVDIVSLPDSLNEKIDSHTKARRLGEKYNADIVLWGHVTLAGIIPNITIVEKSSDNIPIIRPNTTLTKNTLTHLAISTLDDIEFPALTDEVTSIAAFMTGMKYFKENKFEMALDYFYNSLPKKISKYVNLSPIYFYIGTIEILNNKMEDALKNLSMSIEQFPGHSASYLNRGNVYQIKGNFKSAQKDYEKAINIDPNLVAAYNNLGLLYKDLGELDSAIDIYKKGLDISSNEYSLFLNIGVAFSLKGKYDDATRYLKKAIEKEPENSIAYNNLGIVFLKKGEHFKAINIFKQGLENNIKDHHIYYNLASVYHEKGNHKKEITLYSKVIEIKPEFLGAYNNRGLAYARIGDFERSLSDFNVVLKSEKNFRIYLNRGRTYMGLKKCENAIKDFSFGINKNKNNAELHQLRANVYLMKGEFEKAINDFKIALNNFRGKFGSIREIEAKIYGAEIMSKFGNNFNQDICKD